MITSNYNISEISPKN